MGTKCARVSLIYSVIKKQIYEYTARTYSIIDFFGRSMTACLGIESCSHVHLERFINYIYLMIFHPALKFTWEISETCVSFWDINGDIRSRVFSLKADKLTHSRYLSFSSSHSNNKKQSTIPKLSTLQWWQWFWGQINFKKVFCPTPSKMFSDNSKTLNCFQVFSVRTL